MTLRNYANLQTSSSHLSFQTWCNWWRLSKQKSKTVVVGMDVRWSLKYLSSMYIHIFCHHIIKKYQHVMMQLSNFTKIDWTIIKMTIYTQKYCICQITMIIVALSWLSQMWMNIITESNFEFEIICKNAINTFNSHLSQPIRKKKS